MQMKRLGYLLLLMIGLVTNLSAQQLIKGKVTDEKGNPLSYVNVFIKETLEGASSDDNGAFEIKIHTNNTITLCALMLGYQNWERELMPDDFNRETHISMRPSSVSLEEVEIVASNFLLKGSSQWSEMGAVDLVTTGGSAGDLYNSINTLPGAQVAGESGRLFIRGGDSREAQTYIDDMHVLVPYTTNGSDNTPVRGRYSPFMFEGMSFSLGGYDPEYGQGLSSVLPLMTKDESLVNKTGVNLSTVGAGGGGTHSFSEGSASVNLDYQNMKPYYSVVPDRTDWVHPYRKFSGSTQLRFNPDPKTVAKVYFNYDRTSLAYHEGSRDLDLKEDNYYVNGTFRHQAKDGSRWFGGAAFSHRKERIDGALVADDRFRNKEWETHLKVKNDKRFTPFFKWQLGAESMIRGFDESYLSDYSHSTGINHSINSLFATTGFTFSERLSGSFSSRVEYTTANQQWNYLPRLSLNYNLNRFYLSAIAGRYSQLTYNDYLLRETNLPSESCWHYILGGYHHSPGRIYRIEAYYKDYDRLICDNQGVLEASGQGYSKGLDLFFNDAALIPRLEYRLSYSLNWAKRKYRDYPIADVPQFATRHNASVCLRYDWRQLKSIVGITNRYASGRPYHNPNETGWMNSQAPAYNSIDLSWTFLAHKRLIIYASASNILNRKHIYNYTWTPQQDQNGKYSGTPVRSNADQFFFIGIFFTLSGDAAYDVSNF